MDGHLDAEDYKGAVAGKVVLAEQTVVQQRRGHARVARLVAAPGTAVLARVAHAPHVRPVPHVLVGPGFFATCFKTNFSRL